MNAAQLKAIVDALESKAGIISTANESEAGQWLRVALAAEKISNTTSTANATVEGYMIRAAKALESTGSTTGAEENPIYRGFLKRIVDALEGKATVSPGSLEHRAQVAAAAAVFSAFAQYALALPFKTASTDGYWVGGTQYGKADGPELMTGGVSQYAPLPYDTLALVGSEYHHVSDGNGRCLSGTSTFPVTVSLPYRVSYTLRVVSGVGPSVRLNLFEQSTALDAAAVSPNLAPGTHNISFVVYPNASVTAHLTFDQANTRAGEWFISNISVKRAAGVQQLPGYTFTRSGATRQEVEVVTNNSLYGPELIADKGFDNPSKWTASGGWAVTGGKAVATSASNRLVADATLVIGQRYRVRFDYTMTIGDKLRISNVSSPVWVSSTLSASGSIDAEFVADGTLLRIEADTAVFTGTIDNISLTTSNLYQYEGAELVTNGTFDTNTTGWIDASSAPSAITWSAGRAIFSITTGASTPGRLRQTITTVVGRTYQVSCAADANIFLGVGTEAGGTTVLANALATLTRKFVATTTTTWLNFYSTTDGSWGIDNISVKEIITDALDDFPTNVPAIVPGVGLWSRGALVQDVLQSQTFDSATWLKAAATIAANAHIAPDGTTTADTLTEDSATAAHATYSSTAARSGIQTCSVFAKQGTQRYVSLRSPTINGTDYVWATADLQSGTVVTTANGTGYIINFGGGWYRIVIVYTPSATADTPVVGLSNVATNPAVTSGLGNSYLGAGLTAHIWQCQNIAGNHPDGGPIIATGAATASTGADNFSSTALTASSSDGLFLFSSKWPNTTPTALEMGMLWVGGGNNYVQMYRNTGSQVLRIETSIGGSGPIFVSTGAITGEGVAVLRRRAGQWRGGIVQGGTLTWFGSDAAGSALPSGVVNTLYVGNNGGSASANMPVGGMFHKLGDFATDAAVLAAAVSVA